MINIISLMRLKILSGNRVGKRDKVYSPAKYHRQTAIKSNKKT